MKKFKKIKNEEPKETKILKAPKEPKELKESGEPKPQHRVINSLVGNLSHALEDDAGGMDEILENSSHSKSEQDREKKPTKHRFFLIFGLLVFWLAVVGAIVTVRAVGEFAYNISNQTTLKQEFERFILPVIINDPPEFTGAENLPSSAVISSAIWQIILSGETARFERDRYSGMVIIPESDVEAAARTIFGAGFNIEHRSIDYILLAFQYVSETKSYLVPENPSFFTFSPRVTDISRTGDTYRVTVEYIAPTPMIVAGIEHEIVPVKSMIYTITRSRNRTKTIRSIEFSRVRETQF
jgi:hypothetical protein